MSTSSIIDLHFTQCSSASSPSVSIDRSTIGKISVTVYVEQQQQIQKTVPKINIYWDDIDTQQSQSVSEQTENVLSSTTAAKKTATTTRKTMSSKDGYDTEPYKSLYNIINNKWDTDAYLSLYNDEKESGDTNHQWPSYNPMIGIDEKPIIRMPPMTQSRSVKREFREAERRRWANLNNI